jgi:hypothetical protein
MKVQAPNALTINTFGDDVPFPAAASMRTSNDVHSAYLTGIRLVDLLAILPRHCDPLMLFAVDRNDYFVKGSEITDLHVDHALQNLGIEPLHSDDDAYVLRRDDLERILREINHYNAKLLDGITPGEDLSDSWVTAQTHNWNADGPLLCRLGASSTLYIDSHDDCYAYVEAREPTLIVDAVRVLLASAAGTAILNREDGAVEVELAEPGLLESIVDTTGEITLDQRRIRIEGGHVRVPFTLRAWHLGQEINEPVGAVSYDLERRVWSKD